MTDEACRDKYGREIEVGDVLVSDGGVRYEVVATEHDLGLGKRVPKLVHVDGPDRRVHTGFTDFLTVKDAAPEGDLPDMRVSPFSRGAWTGEIRTFDGTDCSDFGRDDLEAVLAYAETPDVWDGDGSVWGMALLRDGRYVTWETFYGPTGDGFSEDAYGGDADIVVSSDLKTAVEMGLTGEGRRRLGLETEEDLDEDGVQRPAPEPLRGEVLSHGHFYECPKCHTLGPSHDNEHELQSLLWYAQHVEGHGMYYDVPEPVEVPLEERWLALEGYRGWTCSFRDESRERGLTVRAFRCGGCGQEMGFTTPESMREYADLHRCAR